MHIWKCYRADHCPLAGVRSNQFIDSPSKQFQHLHFISHFTAVLLHKGTENVIAVYLSYIISTSIRLDYDQITKAQDSDQDIQRLLHNLNTGLKFEQLTSHILQNQFCVMYLMIDSNFLSQNHFKNCFLIEYTTWHNSEYDFSFVKSWNALQGSAFEMIVPHRIKCVSFTNRSKHINMQSLQKFPVPKGRFQHIHLT